MLISIGDPNHQYEKPAAHLAHYVTPHHGKPLDAPYPLTATPARTLHNGNSSAVVQTMRRYCRFLYCGQHGSCTVITRCGAASLAGCSAQADAFALAGAATGALFLALLMASELSAIAENVEVEIDDAVQHLAVEQKAVFRNAITLVVNFNSHNTVKVEVVRMLHTLYAAAFHQVVFTGQQRPEGLDPNVRWTNCVEPWTFFHLCLVYAMVEFPESSAGGYLFMGDDTMVRNLYHTIPPPS